MADWEAKAKAMKADDDEDEDVKVLDAGDIALLQTYGLGPYSRRLTELQKAIDKTHEKIKELCGVKESDTGLSLPSTWDLTADKQMMNEEQPLLVARCTKIIDAGTEDAKYMINIKQIAKIN